jgi:hypothetical protein
MTEAAATEGQETDNTPPQETEPEKRAKRLGWVPKDDFKGDPEHWRSAEEFLDWSDKAAPSLRRDNDRLHRRLTEVEGLLKESKDTLGEFREFASKSEQRAFERAKAEIQSRIEKGAADADAGAVRAGMAELDALNKDAPKPVERKIEQRNGADPKLDPVIQDWIDREQWFMRDRSLNAYAVDVFGDLERNKPGMSVDERLAETKRLTREKFPEKFGGNPMRNGAAAVSEPSGGAGGRKKGKTYEDLPADAKKACDKFVKTIPGFSKEQYVKDYDWEA